MNGKFNTSNNFFFLEITKIIKIITAKEKSCKIVAPMIAYPRAIIFNVLSKITPFFKSLRKNLIKEQAIKG
ncbi:MAG: hypothetical protein RA162_01130 [Arsenophonus sp.]|nr:MAG: hypothetical protein RA162_01130 [Arsenophonus sp.]